MAKPLSLNEEASFEALRDNFSKKVKEYKQKKWDELVDGKRDLLSKELADLKGYLDLYSKGEVADIEVNVRFMKEKMAVLKDLLDPKHIKTN